MKYFIYLLVFIISFHTVKAQHYDTLVGDSSARRKVMVYGTGSDKAYYEKPKFYTFLKNIPATFAGVGRETFQKKSIPALGIIAGASVVLIIADQSISNRVHQFSHYIHLHNNRDYKDVITLHLGGSPIHVYQAPQNLNSVLYSLGEGLPPILISAGLVVHGSLRKDNRSLSVASQIMQSNLTMGIATQLLKRVSGRESPFVATQSGGAWHPARFRQYQHNVPHFDAFPSGHLATMMSTVTVLALNYPEKKWIRPVGYTVMTLVGLAMINNDVHWAGDYPLAIGLGYVSAKVTVSMNRFVSGDHWKRK